MLSVSLEWSEHYAPNNGCHYNHCIAETPFGRFLLTWKGWKDAPDYGFDETPWDAVEYHGWATVEEAKEWAEKEMARHVHACFTFENQPMALLADLRALAEDFDQRGLEGAGLIEDFANRWAP